MKYSEFKNHIFKRLRNEFGFVKHGKMHYYKTEEVSILIDTQKSDYSNAAYVHVGINPKDILEHWNLEEPITCEMSQIRRPLIKGKVLYELDTLNYAEIDRDLDKFMKKVFPHLLSIKSLKKYYKNKKKDLMDYILEFWY